MSDNNNAGEDNKMSVLDRELLNVQSRKERLEQKQKELEEQLMMKIGRYILKEKKYGTFKEFKEDYEKIKKNNK